VTRQLVAHQFASQVCGRDAVGNEIIALQRLLVDHGLKSEIFCHRTDRLPSIGAGQFRRSDKDVDLLFVHYSHAVDSFAREFSKGSRKILIYHNITPSNYFLGTHSNLEVASANGRADLAGLAAEFELGVAHSEFSARELREVGFPNVEVLPYVLLESLYQTASNRSIIDRYANDGWLNFLSVGQIAPHKCLEDSLFIFDYFKRHINARSRLFIVGGWRGTEAYLARLKRLIERLGLRDVVITGSVPQDKLVAFYQIADAFLCMSDHEGFGVPLVEAMRFDVPVFAYASSAVPETLRHAGLLFQEKRWPVIAEAIGIVLCDTAWHARLLAEQRAQVSYYSAHLARERFSDLLKRVLPDFAASPN
jgi:glycosyltransferase involved in cell wall biosynthesis